MRRLREPVLILAMLIVPTLVYLASAKGVRDRNSLDRAIVWVSSPIQWLAVASIDFVAGTWSSYVALVDTEADNQRLRQELGRLRRELERAGEEAKENERLRLLLELHDRTALVRPVAARVIGTSPTPLFRSVRIDRGRRHGVQPGAAVVTHEGVIGRVVEAIDGWSDVMLIADANSSADVLVQRTRVRARIRGDGSGVTVQDLPRTADVVPGDLLITSGIGRVFPKGLVVGRIDSVEQPRFGLAQRIVVTTSADCQRLEEVMVIPTGWDAAVTMEASQ
jgi:rod shape-determining protein MreC